MHAHTHTHAPYLPCRHVLSLSVPLEKLGKSLGALPKLEENERKKQCEAVRHLPEEPSPSHCSKIAQGQGTLLYLCTLLSSIHRSRLTAGTWLATE